MSSTTGNDLEIQKDYGSTTSTWQLENAKLIDMSVDKPITTSALVLTGTGTDPINSSETVMIQTVQSKLNKPLIGTEIEYQTSNNENNVSSMSLDTIAGIENSQIENVHLTYPMLQQGDIPEQNIPLEVTNKTILSGSINSTIVQNIGKLPQNHFMLNVEPVVNTSVQQGTVSNSGQTLWLPTLLATNSNTNSENKEESDKAVPSVSQIIITSSTDSYMPQTLSHPSNRRANFITETNFLTRPKTSKVHILGNITIPKSSAVTNYNQHFITTSNIKDQSEFSSMNHIYKVATNTKPINHSVLNHKNQSSISTVGSQNSIKTVTYSGTISKTPNLKSLNKVNNGAKVNTNLGVNAGSKLALQTGRKTNTYSSNKISKGTSNTRNTPRYVKITQQSNKQTSNDVKNWSLTNVNSKSNNLGLVESNSNKQPTGRRMSPTRNTNTQKLNKDQRVFMQPSNTSGTVVTSVSNTLYQRSLQPSVPSTQAATVRFMTTTDTQFTNVAQMSANQHLTAQILQSLSQPKQSQSHIHHNYTPVVYENEEMELFNYHKANEFKKQIHGDPSTLVIVDDIVGTEERPDLTEEMMRCSSLPLALVLLDHTYAHLERAPPTPVVSVASPQPVPVTPVTPPPSAPTPPPPTPPPVEQMLASEPANVWSGSEHGGERAGSDTETAPEGEEEGRTRCVCDFTHDDGYMICCDRCGEWQHVDCMGIDRQNIPDAYMCVGCQPRPVDRRRARALQLRKREELGSLLASDSDSSGPRLLTVTTYSDTRARPRRKPRRPRRKHDSYECAVTNHYSPELRARMAKIGLAENVHLASAASAHHCTTVPHAGGHILISTKDLLEGMPVMELRGKYMLASQHRAQQQSTGRTTLQKPGPFVFFYRLPRDNTQICIDTRTYGNECRFVRRSCKPNAELQHCIIKGTLHVYLVTINPIPSNTEITVGYDRNNPKQPCACGNPKFCKMGLGLGKKINQNDKPTKRRKRRSTSSSPVSPPVANKVSLYLREQARLHNKEKKSVKSENAKTPVKFPSRQFCDELPLLKEEESKKEIVKSPEVERLSFIKNEVPKESDVIQTPESEVKPEPPIMEEIKIIKEEPVPVMKSEKIEELADTRSPVKEESIKKEARTPKKERIKIEREDLKCKEEIQKDDDEPSTALSPIKDEESKSLKARSATHERSTRSSRVTPPDSLDEKTDDSQDKLICLDGKEKKKMTREERKMEAIMKAFERMEKAQQRKQEVKERQNKRRESDPIQPHDKDIDGDDEPTTPTCTKKRKKRAGRAWSGCNDSQNTSCDEIREANEVHESREARDLRALGLSDARLLVEAAVAPLETDFKLPHTDPLQHSAKKRWLRQAISEESDSPTAESPPNEMVTPLKKRRLARESLCEHTTGFISRFNVSSLKMITDDSPIKECESTIANHCKIKNNYINGLINDYAKQTLAYDDRSSDCDSKIDTYNVSLPEDHSPTKLAMDIRRIIGVPETDEISPEKTVLSYTQQSLSKPIDENENEFNNAKFNNSTITRSQIENLNTLQSDQVEEVIKHNDTAYHTRENHIDSESREESYSAVISVESSPQDEMDDIQKKIHSFHTENIQFLKRRNKKPVKEKRKKVNLNFDINMVDDQVQVKLVNSDIPLPPSPTLESIPLPPTPPPHSIPLPQEPSPPSLLRRLITHTQERCSLSPPLQGVDSPPLDCSIPDPVRSPSPQLAVQDEKSPSPQSVKTLSPEREHSLSPAIVRSPSPISLMEGPKTLLPVESPQQPNSLESDIVKTPEPTDYEQIVVEEKVEAPIVMATPSEGISPIPGESEQITHDCSPVANGSPTGNATSVLQRSYSVNDPRIQQNTPRPVRRKLSISEYRKRQRNNDRDEESTSCDNTKHFVNMVEERTPTLGVFNAQPTQLERQRENLSQRLRREFGLSLPDDDDARPPPPSIITETQIQLASFMRPGMPR